MAKAKIERERAARGEGCLGKAADEEPVFILRGQDRLSAPLVDMWADHAELHGCAPEKVEGARKLARAMRAWQPQKWPD